MLRQVFGETHQGLVRDNNQDRFDVGNIKEDMSYAILCDGMGGQNGGSIAAEISVNFAKKILERDLSEEMTELSIRAVFSSIFSATNALVFEASKKDESLSGMGTTMILAVLKDNNLYIGSVGDSRVYIVGPSEEKQATRDHTIVQLMVEKGEISQEDAAVHPKRHFITRAVGVSDTVDMDFSVESLKEGDTVLICSDGLYAYLTLGGIYKFIKQSIENKSAENLIKLANDGGGADNITAIVMA